MTMQKFTVAAGTRSQPIFVVASSTVAIAAGAGGTASVEYTTGSAVDVQNNIATWQSWPNGTGVGAQSNVPQRNCFIRVTATTAAATVTVTDLVNNGALSDWQIPTRSRAMSRILTRSLTGRSNAVSAASNAFGTGGALVTGLCQHQRVVLAGHFDAVRIAIPNMHTASVSSVLAMVGVSNALGAWNTVAPSANNTGQATAASPAPTETVSASPGVWRNLTFAGASSATLPAAVDATNLLPSFTWSDWAPVYSVDRTDGGTLPVLDIRMFFPVAAGSMTLAYTGVSNNAWAVAGRDDLYTAGRAYRVWNQDVDGVTTPASFTATTTQPMVVPILIQYRSRQYGTTVLSIGDSIYEGTAGTTYPANNFVWQAVASMSSLNFPVEYCSLNAAGASSVQTVRRAQAMAASIAPGVIFAQPASVNNFGTSLGSRTQQEGQGAAGVFQQVAGSVGSSLVLCSMFPVTNAAKAWGATDAQRINLNATLAGLAANNKYTWVDCGSAIDGALTSGQVEPKAALISSDGIHPNDAGQVALSAPAAAGITAAITNTY